MRKSFTIAAGTVLLACAGIAHASVQSSALTPISDTLAVHVQQVSQLLDSNAPKSLKTEVVYNGSGGGGNRNMPAAAASTDRDGNHAMLVAGLMIMGVIIKRRYGKND